MKYKPPAANEIIDLDFIETKLKTVRLTEQELFNQSTFNFGSQHPPNPSKGHFYSDGTPKPKGKQAI